MTDLERLFRRLVDNLIAIDPGRLHRPLALAELTESVIPYRTNRRSLGIDSAEDFDLLLLRLCSGEGGFVRMSSEEIGAIFREQLLSTNPELGLLRSYGTEELVLGTEPLAHALGPGPEEAYAPPEEELGLLDHHHAESHPDLRPAVPEPTRRGSFSAEPAPPAPSVGPPPPRITAEPDPGPRLYRNSGVRCGYCGGRLPSGRAVNFCPHCGENQAFTRCPECQAELELGWRHCIACGHLVEDE